MPHGLKRYQRSKQSHFVTFTCYHRQQHLSTAVSREAVVSALEHTRGHYSLYVYGFVMMPEHVHLLVSEPERGLLANAIQSFKIAPAKRWTALR